MKTIIGLDGRERSVEKVGKYIIHFPPDLHFAERVVYEAIDGSYIKYENKWLKVFPMRVTNHVAYYSCPSTNYYIKM